MSAKKKSKEGGSSRRKGSKRADLSNLGIKKLASAGAAGSLGNTKVRFGKKATDAVTDSLQKFLGELALVLQDLLNISRRKTLTVDLITKACKLAGAPKKVCDAGQVISTRKNRSTLSHAGILRRLKASGLSKDVRSGQAAKQKLVGVAQEYAKYIGHSAGCVTKASKRKTVLLRDIEVTRCI